MAEDPIAEIKAKISIVDLVQSYLPLTKGGKNYRALCPFHNEKTPSFMVSPELGIFKCFGCGKGGDIFAFTQEVEGVSFREALHSLAERAGVKLHAADFTPSPEESRRERLFAANHLAGEFFHFILTKHHIGSRALDYLHRRNLTDETVQTFNLGYAPESWDSLGRYLLKKGYGVEEMAAAGLVVPKGGGRGFYDRFRGRVMFPLFSASGRLIGFSGRILTEAKDQPKYLNSPESPIFSKSRFLFGLHLTKTEIKRAGFALLVEGQMDLITPYQAGLKNVVATAGTALTGEQLHLLRRYTTNLHLGFDADLAGNAAIQRGITLAENLGLNLKVVLTPAGAKDPDDAVRQDAATYMKAVQEAVSIYDYYFTFARQKFGPSAGGGGLEKKQTTEFLVPVIAQIHNEVQKAHYVGRLAGELGVGESAIWKELDKVRGGKTAETGVAADSSPKDRVTVGEYLLALLLKAPLEVIQPSLHKLGQLDFPDPKLGEIFATLKDYASGRKKPLEMAVFVCKLSDEARQKAESLYLLEPAGAEEESFPWSVEATKTLEKLKEETVRRKMVDLASQVKEAEPQGNREVLAKLQSEFSELGKRLVEKP
ncbi:MAG: DNA primase [bacterium]|nr:DNA primase [bacterium]